MKRTISLTQARQEFPTLVDKVYKQMDEIIITVHGKPAAVLMSAEDYESWNETVDILSDPEMMAGIREGEEDIKNGRVIDWEDAKKELGWE